MARYIRFTFLCTNQERKVITDLANNLQRSQSDAVRYVVIEAARQLTQAPQQTNRSILLTLRRSHETNIDNPG